MASKGWGYGTVPHITIVTEADGTYTLYDGVGRMEDLPIYKLREAVEAELQQHGGARFNIHTSRECIEYWQAMLAAYALHPHNPRRAAILLAHQLKWQKINHPASKPSVSLSDLGLGSQPASHAGK